MVELRKRPAPPPAPPKAKKAATGKSKGKKGAAAVEEAPKETKPPATNPADDPKGGLAEGSGGLSGTAGIKTAKDASVTAAKVEADAVKESSKKKATETPKEGESITLEGFGGEVETNDGETTSLAELVDASEAGVVLFTYPKASTPGCTNQACLFRDSYKPLTATGLSIYGLSTDSPKANTTFKTKQNLQYTLLCDPSATLIKAIGFKKAPKGTTRGVFVVNKSGKVLAAKAGGPQATVDVVKALVEEKGGEDDVDGIDQADGKQAADTAAEVADTAEKVDRK